MAKVRKGGEAYFLRPDSKSQVTVEYRDGKPVKVKNVVISTQHSADVEYAKLRETIIDGVIKAVIPAEYLDKDTIFHVNPTGRFVVGGPQGDCGLTGRKIIVDTYGGMGRHGGGAFSGKDPSKVDRSAAYMARYVAKNIVAAELAKRCEVQLAYVIGVAQPVSVLVETFGTAAIPEDKIAKIVQDSFDLSPKGIIQTLDLKRPIYRATAAYGHFGRAPEEGMFTWEKTDRAADLKKAAGAGLAICAQLAAMPVILSSLKITIVRSSGARRCSLYFTNKCYRAIKLFISTNVTRGNRIKMAGKKYDVKDMRLADGGRKADSLGRPGYAGVAAG